MTHTDRDKFYFVYYYVNVNVRSVNEKYVDFILSYFKL